MKSAVPSMPRFPGAYSLVATGAASQVGAATRIPPRDEGQFGTVGKMHADAQGLAPKKVSRVNNVYSDSSAMIHTNTSRATGGNMMA